jgi:hypothetical protein
MSSRVARIIRSLAIALSDPSLRLFLASTKARRLQRSFSNSSSRSEFIAYLGFLSQRDFRRGICGHARRQATWLAFALHHDPQPTLAGIPGMVTIDHFDECLSAIGRTTREAQRHATRRGWKPELRPFSLSPIGTHAALRVSIVDGSHTPERGRRPLMPVWPGGRKRGGSYT